MHWKRRKSKTAGRCPHCTPNRLGNNKSGVYCDGLAHGGKQYHRAAKSVRNRISRSELE